MQSGCQLCHLFATLLMFCRPSKPEDLWSTFCDCICDDLHHSLIKLGHQNPSQDAVVEYSLY
ncbi:hypothetical protein GYMLUDRAFT_127991, partial [Collybiopsis luxurians FD-317 M1]